MAITKTTLLPLEYGTFTIAYHKTDKGDCVSVSFGDLQKNTPVVRIHSSCLFGESFHSLVCDCAAQLDSTLKLIVENKAGVVIYGYAEGRGIGLELKIAALELQRTRHINTVEAFKALGFEPDIRTYDVGVMALRQLNVATTIKFASQNPRKLAAVREGGFQVVEQLHPKVQLNKHNIQELRTKKQLLGYNILHELES